MNLLFKGGFAVEDSKFSPQFEVFDKVCVENCMDLLYKDDWIAYDKVLW